MPLEKVWSFSAFVTPGAGLARLAGIGSESLGVLTFARVEQPPPLYHSLGSCRKVQWIHEGSARVSIPQLPNPLFSHL